jgi:hypothetical protein
MVSLVDEIKTKDLWGTEQQCCPLRQCYNVDLTVRVFSSLHGVFKLSVSNSTNMLIRHMFHVANSKSLAYVLVSLWAKCRKESG